MFAATTSPSYSPTWVSGQMPLTSPIAQSRSPARRWSSTGIPWGSASTPTVSRPIPSTRGRRPVATSSRSPRTSAPPSNCRTYSSPSRRAAVACIPSISSMPSRRRASPSASPSGAGSRASTCSAPSTSTASPPRRRTTWAISTPTGPPPRISSRRGTAFMPGRLAVGPHAVELTESRDRRHDRVGAGRHDDVLRGVADAVDLDHARAGQPARASQQADAPVRQPALLAGVGIARHHEVPPRQRGRDVDLRARACLARALHRLARAQQRLRRDARPVGALAADQLSLDDGDAQPARGQRRSAVLAGRPAAENDHVVVAHVGSSVPACSATM